MAGSWLIINNRFCCLRGDLFCHYEGRVICASGWFQPIVYITQCDLHHILILVYWWQWFIYWVRQSISVLTDGNRNSSAQTMADFALWIERLPGVMGQRCQLIKQQVTGRASRWTLAGQTVPAYLCHQLPSVPIGSIVGIKWQ